MAQIKLKEKEITSSHAVFKLYTQLYGLRFEANPETRAFKEELDQRPVGRFCLYSANQRKTRWDCGFHLGRIMDAPPTRILYPPHRFYLLNNKPARVMGYDSRDCVDVMYVNDALRLVREFTTTDYLEPHPVQEWTHEEVKDLYSACNAGMDQTLLAAMMDPLGFLFFSL